MGRSQVRRRTTVKRKQYGGAELPLITYTPNYREMDFKDKKLDYTKWGGRNDMLLFSCTGTLTLPKMPPQRNGRLTPLDIPTQIKINLHLTSININIDNYKDEVDKFKKVVKDLGIVFCLIYEPTPNNKRIVIIDNYGNRYENSFYQQPEGYHSLVLSHARAIGRNPHNIPLLSTTIVPDSMTDFLIENESTRVFYTSGHPYMFPTENVMSYTSNEYKPKSYNTKPIPHRKFEPTAELANYLAALEARPANDKPATANSDTQTNAALNEKITPAKAIENVRRHMENEFTKLRQRFNNVDDMLFLVGSMGSQAIHPNYVKRVNANSRNKTLWVNSNAESNSNNEGQGKNKNKNKTKKNVGV